MKAVFWSWFLTVSILLTRPVLANELALTELPARLENVSGGEGINPISGEFNNTVIQEPVSTARIEINVPARRLKLFNNNELVYEFPVAVGAPSFKTPVGQRELTQIVWNPWWLPPDSPWAKGEKPVPPGPNNPLGPVKMNLGAAILLHGTNKPQSVGRAASHGCMRMNNEDARQMAWWIQSNLTDKKDITLFDEYQKKKGRSFYVSVPVPVPVEIKYEVFEKKDDQILVHPDVYGRVANKKAKVKEWLLSQGVAYETLDEARLFEKMSQVKRDSLQIYLSELMLGVPQPANTPLLNDGSVLPSATPVQEVGAAAHQNTAQN